ncbi:glycosyltransferase [Celeribacter neptunius]|uniref:glycosyltransferase n=1 Tax=Celeribacter neptunius TaxID=588602 RepID=UPI0015A681F0|nr:glycosyltransferase [Celeribacter neptunius]
MKICLFAGALSRGGVRRAFLDLASGFRDLGHSVDLLVLDDAKDEIVIPEGVNLTRVGKRSRQAFLPLIAYLRRNPPDLMITARPYVDIVSLLARRLSGARQTTLVWTFHTSQSHEAVQRSFFRQVLYRIAFLMSHQVEHLVAVSDGVARDLEHSHLPKSPTKRARHVVTIPNPIPIVKLEGMPIPHPWLAPAQGRPFTIVSCGRLVPQKDHETLLAAFALLKLPQSARLLILGDGPLKEQLQLQAVDLGLEGRINFCGHVKAPKAYMQHADLFVSSSQWEGFGLAIAEALTVGCPVVATDCPSGPAELLDHGRYGLMVPPKDPVALAKAMKDTSDGEVPVFLQQELDEALMCFAPRAIAQSYIELLRMRAPEGKGLCSARKDGFGE